MRSLFRDDDIPRDAEPDANGAVSRALAYDRRHANRRAVFSLQHALRPVGDGAWAIRRVWRGIADETLGEERVAWHPRLGLTHAEAYSPSMGERLSARHAGEDAGRAVYDSTRIPRQGAGPLERRLRVAERAFTLASAPLEIAAAWPALLRGARVRRRFLVLKVQRHAAVDMRLLREDATHVEIALTPAALPLRWLFGRTVYRIRRHGIALETIDGLLDPRDRRHDGRWHEYLGRIEFATPVVLDAVRADAGAADDGA